jgi:hypothetical protein
MVRPAEIQCADKVSLRRKYNLYVRAYSEAVNQLTAVSSIATRAEWELAWKLANRAKQLCDDTLAEIRQHKAVHGC